MAISPPIKEIKKGEKIKHYRKKAIAAVLATMILTAVIIALSCDTDDNNPKPNPCECPNGTGHYDDGMCCTGKDDCMCMNFGARPKLCMCVEKKHLGVGEAKCGADENLCGCTWQSYGELFAGSSIKIYRIGAVEDFTGGTTIATAVQVAKDGYAGLDNIDKSGSCG